jgi:hypothetical protein
VNRPARLFVVLRGRIGPIAILFAAIARRPIEWPGMPVVRRRSAAHTRFIFEKGAIDV